MSIWFTANTYFSRPQAAIDRGFSSITEMDKSMVKSWNDKVKDGDTVYVLGNFGWDPLTSNSCRFQLKGNIVYQVSIYDGPILSLNNEFEDVSIISAIQVIDPSIVISTFPLMEWPDMEKSHINVHGGTTRTDLTKDQVNCSWDYWDGSLVSIGGLLDIHKIAKEDTTT